MSGPDWPRQLAQALTLLHNRARTDGRALPAQFYLDAREAVRHAWAGTGEQGDAMSVSSCQRRHVDDVLALTKAEVAAQLHCSPRTVGHLLATGGLHRVPGLGRSCRVAAAEVAAFVAAGHVVTAGPGRQARVPFPAGSSMSPPAADRVHRQARAGTSSERESA